MDVIEQLIFSIVFTYADCKMHTSVAIASNPGEVTGPQKAAAGSLTLVRVSTALQFLGMLCCFIGPAIMWYRVSGTSCSYDPQTFFYSCTDVTLSFTALAVSVSAGGTWGSWSGSGPYIGLIGGAIIYLGAIFAFVSCIISMFMVCNISKLAATGAQPPAPAPGGGCQCCCYASVPAVNGVGKLVLVCVQVFIGHTFVSLQLLQVQGLKSASTQTFSISCALFAAWTAWVLILLGAIVVGSITSGLGLFMQVGAGVPITAIGIVLYFIASVMMAAAGCQLKGVSGIGEGTSCCCVAHSSPMDQSKVYGVSNAGQGKQ